MANASPPLAALVLAGGRARRMGGADKAWLALAGRPLILHVVSKLSANGRPCAISANGDPARFQTLDLPVLPDRDNSYPGPLAGIQAGLHWARSLGARALVCAPVDTPLVPDDLVPRLEKASGGERLAYARAAGRDHPTLALWPLELLEPLEAYLARGERRVMGFMAQQNAVAVDWDSEEAFANLNTPEDLARAEALLAQRAKT